MKRILYIAFIAVLFFQIAGIVDTFAAGRANPMKQTMLQVCGLQCEYLTNPLGLDVRQPRFSWQIESVVQGAGQSAYQIIVASSPEKLAKFEGDVWDSGRLESPQTVQIEYGGVPLVSSRRYYWTVRVWDNLGREGDFTTPLLGTKQQDTSRAWLDTGLFDEADWAGAQWIAWKPQAVWKAEWDVRKQKEFASPRRSGHFREGIPGPRAAAQHAVHFRQVENRGVASGREGNETGAGASEWGCA